MPNNIVKGKIGNALESVAPDHILGVAQDIFDEELQMYQSEINISSVSYDISANHLIEGNPTPYADLAAALGTNGANVPESMRKGGMSIKFIQSTDNNYVQFRLMHPLDNASTAADDFTNTANWQGVVVTPTRDSKNVITSGGVAGQISKTNVTATGAGTTPFIFKAGVTYHFKNNLTTLVTISHRNTPDGTSEDIVSVPASQEIDYTPTTNGLYLRYGQPCNLDIWLKNSLYDYVNSVEVYAHSIDTTLDNTPTKNSNHAAKSGGIYDAIDGEDAKIFVAENSLDRVEEGLQMETSVNLYDSSKQTPETISPHYYVNGVPASTTQYDSQWNCTALIPVEPETQYTLCMVPHPVSYTKPWGSAAQGLFAYDKDGNYLNFMTTDNTFTTPKYARFIRFNYYIGGNITLAVLNTICMLVKGSQTPSEYEAYKTEFGVIKYLQNDIAAANGVVNAFQEIVWEQQTGTKETGKYISNDGSIAELGVYDTYFFNVSPGDVYNVKSTYNTGGARRWAVYNSSTPSSTSLTQLGGLCSESTYDDTITINEGDVLLAVVEYNPTPRVTTSKGSKLNILQDTAIYPIGYKIDGNSIYLSVKYGNGKDLMILMKSRERVNHLFDFDTLGLKDNVNPTPSISFHDFTTLWTGTTDWHAPFKIQALSDIDGDNINQETGQYNDFFTGGSHTYNNTADGVPTARLIGVEFYVDGKKRTSGNGLASHIEIRWSNAVQAQNTTKADGSGREVLTENHRIVFDGITFYEDIDLVPTEDILCKTWYGFQGVINALYEAGLRYINSTNREEYATNVHSTCGSKNCSGVIAHSDTNGLEIEVNEAIDLGKRDLTTGSGAFYEQSVKKVYMNIISNNNLTANYHYALNGSWRFYPV